MLTSISTLALNLISDLGGDTKMLASISRNNLAYKSAIRQVWPDKASSDLIIQHTNAIYLRQDTRPKKGEYKNKPYYLFEIVVDSALIRSEIDTHRELIACHLLNLGINFQEIRIIPAKGNMRNRHISPQDLTTSETIQY